MFLKDSFEYDSYKLKKLVHKISKHFVIKIEKRSLYIIQISPRLFLM